MFTINNKSDYGLLIISHLKKKDGFIPLSKLIEETRLPHRFIARIAADLVKHGILKSREGKVGGYKLAKQPKEISLYEYLKIFEEDVNFVKCQDPEYRCEFKENCNHDVFFKSKLISIMTKTLTSWTLADLYKN